MFAVALAATGLASCGGVAKHTVAYQAPVPAAATPARPAAVKQPRRVIAAPRKVTAPANGDFYARSSVAEPGRAPLRCLRSNGLTKARRASESNVWEGSVTNAGLDDPNKKVFVDGPYRSVAKASVSAHSLDGVEFSAAGGVWVVSASLPSRLRSAVDVVAACLAGSGSPRSTPARR